MNDVKLMGRMVDVPMMYKTKNGIPVAAFSIAVQRHYRNANKEKEIDQIECIAIHSTAEIIRKYYRPGRLAVISGRLQPWSVVDESGQRSEPLRVMVEQVYFGSSHKTECVPAELADDTPFGTGGHDGGQ